MSNVPLDDLRSAEQSASAQPPSDAPMSGVTPCHTETKPFHLQLVGRDGPYAATRYSLYVDGRLILQDQKTDGEGWIRQEIPAGKKGELHVWFDKFEQPEIYYLTLLPELPPVDTDEGLAIRLRDLGAGVGSDNVVQEVHVRTFQRRFQLTETGVVDGTLRADVKRIFGS